MALMGHRPLTTALEAWWADYGSKPKSPEWRAYMADYLALLSLKADELLEEHSNDGRFGMSKAGNCTRAAALSFLDHDKEPFDGSTLATFFIGHLLECMGIASLQAVGVPVTARAADGGQFVARIDPFMHSATDGMVSACDLVPTDAALSIKTMGYKMGGRQKGVWKRYGFAALPFDGMKKAHPNYWVQSQAEMFALNLQATLLLVVAKDKVNVFKEDPYMMGPTGSGSLTFYTEIVKRDDEFIERQLLPTWTKVWESVQAGEIPEPLIFSNLKGSFVDLIPADMGRESYNRAQTGTWNSCDYCDFVESCRAAIRQEKTS